MQSVRIQYSLRIKILPKNSNSLNRINFKPLDILAVFINTFEKSGITPFLGLRTFDVGEHGCTALTLGDEVGEDGGFTVADCAHLFVFDRVEPIVVFAEKVAAAVSGGKKECVSLKNRTKGGCPHHWGNNRRDMELSSYGETGLSSHRGMKGWKEGRLRKDIPYNLKILHVVNRFVAL